MSTSGISFPNMSFSSLVAFYHLSLPLYFAQHTEALMDRTPHSFYGGATCFLFRLETWGCHKMLLRQPSTTAEFCLKRWQTRDIAELAAPDTSHEPISFLTTKLDSSHYFTKKSLRNTLPSHHTWCVTSDLSLHQLFKNVHPAPKCTKNFYFWKSCGTGKQHSFLWNSKVKQKTGDFFVFSFFTSTVIFLQN